MRACLVMFVRWKYTVAGYTFPNKNSVPFVASGEVLISSTLPTNVYMHVISLLLCLLLLDINHSS